MQLHIFTDGSLRCVYGEAIDLFRLGETRIRRASYVEPNETGDWVADLSPVMGPFLGPFKRRSQALLAEQVWLERNWPSETGS